MTTFITSMLDQRRELNKELSKLFFRGEAAFYGLSEQSFYAAMPMVPRLKEVNPQIPITFIYGGRSWIDKASGLKVKGLRNKSYVDVKIIPSGGHHAFAQCASEFNAMVLEITKKIDANFDFEKSL